jgi:hypothetical protein
MPDDSDETAVAESRHLGPGRREFEFAQYVTSGQQALLSKSSTQGMQARAT